MTVEGNVNFSRALKRVLSLYRVKAGDLDYDDDDDDDDRSRMDYDSNFGESEDDQDDDDSSSSPLTVLVQELFLHLQQEEQQQKQQRRPQQQQPPPLPSARDLLGDSTNHLVEILARLLQDRVHFQALLPSTQDVEAEQEVLDDSTNAQTLTWKAMTAACLYAQLLRLPGALGSGLVDLQLLSSLAALVRRWSLETCGRESDLGLSLSTGVQVGGPFPSPTKSPPKKKTRRYNPARHDDQNDLDHDDVRDQASSASVSSMSNLHLGLQVAHAVTRIPMQKEFVSWSFEAKEQLLEALIAAFGTTAALQSALPPTYHLIEQTTMDASKAWQACLFHSNTHHNRERQHETTVLIARGLLHLLQFKDILPCGERGKLDAHVAASNALQDLMEGLSRQQQHPYNNKTTTNRQPSLGDATNTPSRRRRQSSGKLLLATPATATTTSGRKTPGRRRRSSIDGNLVVPEYDGKNIGDTATLLSPPALKGRRSSFGTTLGTPSGVGSTSIKPRPVWSVFLGLLQKIATTPGMERANYRTPTIECLTCCIPALPLEERAHFLRYIHKLTNSKVSLHRLVACDLLGRIFVQDWLPVHEEDHILPTSGTTADSPKTPSTQDGHPAVSLPLALWKALQGRLIDKLAPVRARAAASIEAVIPHRPEWLEDDMILLNQLRRRALKDETATVRKAAVLAITQIFHSHSDSLTEPSIGTICESSRDQDSILTRKAAAESLTGLLAAFLDHPMTTLLEQAWSTCVLPMVAEDGVATKAIAGLDQIVVTPLLKSQNGTETDHQRNATATAWRLLAHVAISSGSQGSSKGTRHSLQVGLHQLALEDPDRIHKDLWKSAVNIAITCLTDNESSEAQIMGVWCLLETILSSATAKQVKLMVTSVKRTHLLEGLCENAWKAILERCRTTPQTWILGTLRSCLAVVARLAPGLDAAAATDIQADLSNELQQLSFRPEVAGSAIAALCAISVQLNTTAEAQISCQTWIQAIYSACQAELTECFQHEFNDRAVSALFLVGELNMIGFRPDDDEKATTHSDETDVLRGMHVPPPRNLQELVQTLLPSTLPNSSTPTPTPIRAHAFTVLGKLCLRDEQLAKQSLNLLARELHPSVTNPNPSIQSNALLVLGDLCVRYTNMVDRYLPTMATCLQSGTSDPGTSLFVSQNPLSSITRKHAVLLLSSLLLQDYIKWRGLLFHRFLVACSDDDEHVATLAEAVLSGPLSTRQPKLFFNHFVEALFVLNKCTAHPIYVAAANQGDGGSGIAVGFEGIYLDGDLGRTRRRRMYDFMLSKLSDEEKIGVTARLAKEVLAEAVSHDGDLSRVCHFKLTQQQTFSREHTSAWNVLTDAFYILTCPHLKVGKTNEEEESSTTLDDPNVLPSANHQMTVAKNRLLTKISRKQLIEIVLPIVCQLKVQLQASCSPLLKDLQLYLVDTFRRYKNEVREYLANDPQLLQEMEYDVRQFASSVGTA